MSKLSELHNLNLANITDKTFSDTFVEKESDGSYRITTVSTAAVADSVGETFTIAAIDYDIQLAKESGNYPEFRLFHTRGLGIGKVEKMSRVGIFAIDEGKSYTDKFSLAVCEKMLANNIDGKWKVSRGFRVLEASWKCDKCDSDLVLKSNHLTVGFRCPACGSVYSSNRSALKNLNFEKAQTFDITITDIPCVSMTGASANRENISTMEDIMAMTKKELRAKLLDAGISKELVDEKIATLSEDQLKEFDGVPTAILKELQEQESEVVSMDEIIFDKEFIDAIGEIVEERMKEIIPAIMEKSLENLTVDIGDMDVELKEVPEIANLITSVQELKEMVASLTKSSVKKENADETSGFPKRTSRLIVRKKSSDEDMDDEEDEDEEDEDEEAEKELAFNFDRSGNTAVILDTNGVVAKDLSSFIMQD